LEDAVAQLIYSAIASLDGYIEDAQGSFDWAAPDEEVHAFVNDLQRSVGTHLYGRRMYETMAYWESPPDLAAQRSVVRDFAAIWQAADKVVYSTTLQTAAGARTRIERNFDPVAVREMKASAIADVTVGGAALAAHAFAAGLVDECQLFFVPVVVGGGKHALPTGDLRLSLELLDERRFASGTVYLRYRIRR
jgi:dihydrofolate reductase